MAEFKIKFQTNIKYFKSYMKQIGKYTSNFKPVFAEYDTYLRKDTQQQIKREVNPEGKPWEPLAESTLRQKRTNLKLRETFYMVGTIYSKVTKISYEFGIKDKKYQYHHYGTKKMPRRVIIGVGNGQRRKKLTIVIRQHLKRLKSRYKVRR